MIEINEDSFPEARKSIGDLVYEACSHKKNYNKLFNRLQEVDRHLSQGDFYRFLEGYGKISINLNSKSKENDTNHVFFLVYKKTFQYFDSIKKQIWNGMTQKNVNELKLKSNALSFNDSIKTLLYSSSSLDQAILKK